MKSIEEFWCEVYVASIQGSRSNGPINGAFDSALFAGRATNDANAAVSELRSARRSGEFDANKI